MWSWSEMVFKLIFLLAIPLASCQYPRQRAPTVSRTPHPAAYEDYPQQQAQAPPVQSAPRPTPRNSDILLPATVHYVNIGAELAGDYKFGYDTGKRNDGQSFREETRLPDGSVQGAYGYVDETGTQRIVKYRAGKDGFHILKEGESDGPAPARQEAPKPAQPAYRPPAQAQPAYRPPAASQSAYRAPPAPAQPAYTAPAAAPPAYRPQPAAQPAYRAPPVAAQPAYRPPAAAQPAYRAPPAAARPSYRAPAAAQPRPELPYVYGAQPAARPEHSHIQRSQPQPARPRYTPPPKEAYDESQDYDYPSNDIGERRLVPIDTTLFNYNIGTNHGSRS